MPAASAAQRLHAQVRRDIQEQMGTSEGRLLHPSLKWMAAEDFSITGKKRVSKEIQLPLLHETLNKLLEAVHSAKRKGASQKHLQL